MQKLSDYTMLSSEKSSTDAIDSDITLPRPNSCISVNYSNIIVNNDGSVKTTTNPLLKKDVTLGHDLDQQEKSLSFDSRISESKEPLPDMWSRNYIGLYCQYAAVGLIYGSTGTLIPFCAYTFNGPANGESAGYIIIHSFKLLGLTLTMMSLLSSVCKCQEHSYLRLEHKDILRYLHRYLSTFRFEKEAVHAVWLGRSSGPSASPDIHLQHHEPHCVVSQSNGGERFRYAQ